MTKESKSQSPASKTELQPSTYSELTPLEQKFHQLPHQQDGAAVLTKLKPSRKLSLPLFSIGHSLILTVKIIASMFEGDMSLGDFGDVESKPTLCHVLNCDTGQEGFLICNAVIKSTLEKLEGGYVGRYFQFRDGGKAEGKRYRTVDITLMEEE